MTCDHHDLLTRVLAWGLGLGGTSINPLLIVLRPPPLPSRMNSTQRRYGPGRLPGSLGDIAWPSRHTSDPTPRYDAHRMTQNQGTGDSSRNGTGDAVLVLYADSCHVHTSYVHVCLQFDSGYYIPSLDRTSL